LCGGGAGSGWWLGLGIWRRQDFYSGEGVEDEALDTKCGEPQIGRGLPAKSHDEEHGGAAWREGRRIRVQILLYCSSLPPHGFITDTRVRFQSSTRPGHITRLWPATAKLRRVHVFV
jgi:hypothetical protein